MKANMIKSGNDFRKAACHARMLLVSMVVAAAATLMSANADPVLIADVRANYVAAATNGQTTQTATADPLGLPDTSGAGHWNYLYNLNGVTPTLMTWGGSQQSPAYGDGIGQHWGTVTNHDLTGWTSQTLGVDELAWHPGSDGDATIIRWTAGESQAGTIRIAGALVPGSVSFAIKVDGVLLTTSNSFDVSDVTISGGSTVDFILSGGGGGASKISARIYQLTTGILKPPAPTGLFARGINEQVNLTWTASTGATSYSIKRSTTGGEPYTTIATGVTSTTYADAGLTNGSQYYYVVSASNSAGEGADSAQASATPENVLADVRADYQGAATNGQTTASFGGGSGLPDTNGAGHWNYYVLSGGTTPVAMTWNWSHFSGSYQGGGNSWGTVTNHGIWDGVTPGPTELAWHHGAGTPAVIRWTAGESEAGTVRITGALVPGNVSFAIKVDGVPLTLTGNSFDFADVPVSNGSNIDFILTGSDGGGGASKISAKILQLSTGTLPPPPPSGLVARGVNGQVNLNWTASVGSTAYNVKRSLTDGGAYAVIASGLTETSYADTDLTNGITYYYVVSAANDVGESGNSAQAAATPVDILADIRADYQTAAAGQTTAAFGGGAGLPDTAGAGNWNYYWQNKDDDSLTALPYGGNPSFPNAYGGLGHRANGGWANVSHQALFGDVPAATELGWHPGGNGTYNNDPGHEGPALIRWTAGASEAGTVNITGSVRLGSATFAIKLDGVELYSSAASGSFALNNVSVSGGGNLDFVLTGGPGGNSYISAQVFRGSANPGGGYAAWAASQVPPGAGGPDHTGPDGIPNLMLYALDLKLDGTNGFPGTLNGNLLSFAKREAAVTNGDVSYTIQVSDDLGLTDPWHKVAPNNEDGTTIDYILPSGKGRTFARLVVSQGAYAGP